MYPYERAAKQAAENRSASIDHPETVWGWLTSDPTAAATVILCFVTGALAIATYALYLTTSRLARDAKETGTKQAEIAAQQAQIMAKQVDLTIQIERAFVFIKTFEVHVINAEVRILPQWMNSGSTIANPFRNYVNWSAFVGVPTSYPDLDTSGKPMAGPGVSLPTYIPPRSTQFAETMTIPLSVMEDIRNGKKRLFVWGWAEYRDTFVESPLHRSEFCEEIKVTNMGKDAATGKVTIAISTAIYGPYNTAN